MVKLRIALAVVALSAIIFPAHAAIVNGGFETGDFTGWQTIGADLIVTAAAGSGPTEGIFQAIALTVGDGQTIMAATAVQTAAFAGMTLAELTALILDNGVPVQGSAIAQIFGGNAGEVLSFDWNFLTNEERIQFGGDFAFVTILPTGGTQELADALTTVLPSATFFEHETGFQTFNYVLPATGFYRIAIGVLDVIPATGPVNEPHAFDSGLLIDNVRLTVVPEPASLALLGMGLAGMAGLRMRRKGR